RGSGGAASTGLGLAIVDAVTTAHGGRVRVDSQPGRTRFAITLPRLDELRPSPGPAAPARAFPPEQGRGPAPGPVPSAGS
ncbi:MAG TPA: ATP-binding protein, partial [Streptosporangiaceae bacterium]